MICESFSGSVEVQSGCEMVNVFFFFPSHFLQCMQLLLHKLMLQVLPILCNWNIPSSFIFCNVNVCFCRSSVWSPGITLRWGILNTIFKGYGNLTSVKCPGGLLGGWMLNFSNSLLCSKCSEVGWFPQQARKNRLWYSIRSAWNMDVFELHVGGHTERISALGLT